VEPLTFKPLRIPPENWKKVQFDWFRRSSLRVPLIVAKRDSPGNFWKVLQDYDGNAAGIPEVPFENSPAAPASQARIAAAEKIRANADLQDDRITIDTSKPGHPLWVKVSYHPDWRITEGAGELYPASPAFMLLVPRTPRVVLTFDTASGVYLWGKILSLFTLVVLLLKAPPLLTIMHSIPFTRLRGAGKRPAGDGETDPGAIEPTVLPSSATAMNARFLAAFALMAVIIVAAVSTRNHRDPVLLCELAAGKLEDIVYGKSGPGASATPGEPALPQSRQTLEILGLLNECIIKFGSSAALDNAVLYKGSLLYAWNKWDDLRPMLENFLHGNPDTRIYAQCLSWLGEAALNTGQKDDAQRYFRQALCCWPPNNATKQAGLHLSEKIGAAPLLQEAKDLMTSGRYLEAYNICGALASSPDRRIRDQSVLCLAYCCFYMNRCEEACDHFLQWFSDNFDSPESAAVQVDFRQCQAIAAQNRDWMQGYEPGVGATTSGIIVRLLEGAGIKLR
jgi:hypothetical protein